MVDWIDDDAIERRKAKQSATFIAFLPALRNPNLHNLCEYIIRKKLITTKPTVIQFRSKRTMS